MASDPRLELIENVRALLESDPRINGLVLIGSGAVGFRDEISDVDLMAAVVSGLDAADVSDDLANRLRSALPLYRYIQTPPARADELPKGIRDHVQRLTCVANAAPLTQAFRDAIDTLAMYDRTLFRDELGDTEFSGLAEWLSRKYPELL